MSKDMKLWGGRFKDNTSACLEEFNQSIRFDQKMYAEDIEGSIAHSKMLCKIGILTEEELNKIIEGLRLVQVDIETGKAELTIKNEDIHMNIEALLTEKIGTLAKKVHTGRSRNDQVALDLRLYTKKQGKEIEKKLLETLEVLLQLSKDNIDVIMPGYTHLQNAQPIRLSFHLMAYFQMFKRDLSRFLDVLDRMDDLVLGSGAMSGVSYDTDREYLKELLGFKSISDNAMDAVSDRDYVIEFQSTASILMMHFSRLSEELIIWSSSEFNFIEISDKFTTGSSIMPQKKNPDACELLRGKTGRVYGNLVSILTVMKSLPLAYNKDMQEDKEGLFDTIDTLLISLQVFNEMLREIKFNEDVLKDAVKRGFLNATDLADYLVNKGIPFRECHEIVGNMTAYCIENNKIFEDMTIDEYHKFSPLFDEDVFEAIDIVNVIENKKSYGSTKKSNVLKSIENGENKIKELKTRIC